MNLWNGFIHPISTHFRRLRGASLLTRYPNLASFKICDLGGSRHFWEESGLPLGNIVILNISHGETHAYAEAYRGLRVILYDGDHIPAADCEYDLLICNSVIEHVRPEKRVALCAEMRRVAKRVYLQTPAFEFPIEPHFVLPFIHWLPRRLGELCAYISPWYLLGLPTRALLQEYFRSTHLLKCTEVEILFPGTKVEMERFCKLRKSHLVFWRRPE